MIKHIYNNQVANYIQIASSHSNYATIEKRTSTQTDPEAIKKRNI